jgi:hypothetical protein
MNHSVAEVRAALFNRKLKELPVEFPIDGLEDYDGELSVLELKAKDARNAEKAAEDSDGVTNEVLMMAGIVVKSLMLRETKERVFQDNDLESVSEMGLSVLKPLNELISKASGVGPDALAAAKKNSPIVPGSASATSSAPSSEAAPTEASTNS